MLRLRCLSVVLAVLSLRCQPAPVSLPPPGEAEAWKAKEALLDLMRTDASPFEGADPKAFEKLKLKPGDEGEFRWGAFRIHPSARRYSADVVSEAAAWFYSGTFTVDSSGRWKAVNTSTQHMTAPPKSSP